MNILIVIKFLELQVLQVLSTQMVIKNNKIILNFDIFESLC